MVDLKKKEIIHCCFGKVNAKTTARFAKASINYVYKVWWEADLDYTSLIDRYDWKANEKRNNGSNN